ncbi:MAG TPA: homocysteine S-methyltransferase family protein [Gammaproteobacteria bacterium]
MTTLRPDRCLLIDGGTGSELRRRGVRLDPIAWSGPAALAHFDTLVAIHADYIAAGADVVTTNTFATTRFVLEAAGLGAELAAIVRASVEAAKRAREQSGRDILIAGSISCFPPGFDVARYPPPDEERAAYAELASLLAALGVDLLVLEMMEDDAHARRACEAAGAVGLPFWLGLSARRRADGTLAAYDFPETPLDGVLDALAGFGPEVVNVMHTPPDDVAPALAAVRTRWSGPIGAYPEIEGPGGALEPAELAARAEEWLRAGVRVLGGCCGTEPRHVRALRALLDRQSTSSGFQPKLQSSAKKPTA